MTKQTMGSESFEDLERRYNEAKVAKIEELKKSSTDFVECRLMALWLPGQPC